MTLEHVKFRELNLFGGFVEQGAALTPYLEVSGAEFDATGFSVFPSAA